MYGDKLWRLRWTGPPAFLAVTWPALRYYEPRSLKTEGKSTPSGQEAWFAASATQLEQQKRAPSGRTEHNDSNTETTAAWRAFMQKLNATQMSLDAIDWSALGDSIKNYIVPDWTRYLPVTVQKLQRELAFAPGSLAYEIWEEARDVSLNPEIALDATVRVGDDLCPEEKTFRRKRRKHAAKALKKYLDLEEEVHPDDVPIIAMCGSGGGLRALVAGTGSYQAAQEAGIWDCVTYTAGVSGSCWLQTLYHSSLTGRNFEKMRQHLKHRLGVHMAFPPDALNLLTTAPANKYLLRGLVEKLKGDPNSDFGLVDIYGLLLGARLLVPKGELGVNDQDLKLSNQRESLRDGQHPLPIYTAVRHEIPAIDESEMKRRRGPENIKEEAQKEAWFQWFEFTPYEFFCEELNAGIPMWAVGRHFNEGRNVVPSNEYGLPEVRIPLLMGIWGSAFCATLSHYYKEIRPVVRGITGFGGIDSLIEGKTPDLVRVHPIDPASIPNYVLGMKDKLPPSCPESIFRTSHLHLMDAGMSNNLPIYPLLRPGREVDIIIAFDASADIKQENWLSIVDGYARQRGIKGWPTGAGWPKPDTKPEEVTRSIEETDLLDKKTAEEKLSAAQGVSSGGDPDQVDTLMMSDPRKGAKAKQSSYSSSSSPGMGNDGQLRHNDNNHTEHELGYCNVWLGTKQEMTSSDEPPPSKRLFHPIHQDPTESEFHLMRPDAGIAVIYFPLLPNPSADSSPSSLPLSSSSTSTGNGGNPIPQPRTPPPGTSTNEPPPGPLSVKPSTINPEKDDFLSTWNFVYTPEQIDAVVGLAKANFRVGEDQVKRVVRAVYERRKRRRLERERAARDRRLEREAEQFRRTLDGLGELGGL